MKSEKRKVKKINESMALQYRTTGIIRECKGHVGKGRYMYLM